MCNLGFSEKSNLNRHENSIHKGLKFKCDHCDKEFSQKGSVAIHFNSVHQKIKFK